VPLWRAPHIHGELLKLGIEVSERTVSRILRTVERPPSQTRKTFLKNHFGEIVAIDPFTVPTIRLRVLFVFLVVEHQRRKVVHFAERRMGRAATGRSPHRTGRQTILGPGP
jgi:putative transposase